MSDRHRELLDELEAKNQIAFAAGGAQRLEKQHRAGKLSAREETHRCRCSIPTASSKPIALRRTTRRVTGADQAVLGDGVITGHGRIDGRAVCVFAQDFTVFGGALGATHAGKIVKLMDLALKIGVPILGLNDSGGARIQEGVAALGGYADIFLRNTLASGVVPQISCIMGPCAGGAVYSPAITDFVLMVEGTSYMFITGPDVVKAVTHEQVTKEALGGAATHSEKSGVCQLTAPDDKQCLELLRELMSFLPSNNGEEPPRVASSDPAAREAAALDTLVPPESNKPYDMRDLLRHVIDDGYFFGAVAALRREFADRLRAYRWSVRSASWPISRRCWLACWTSTPASKARASCGFATASTSRSSPSS